jgi:hypothetical protein
VFDRGAHHTEILWLIYHGPRHAKAIGGVAYCSAITGCGDARRPALSQSPVSADVGGARRRSYSRLFGPDSVLGQWLRSKAYGLKVNDLLCLPAGSRASVERKLTLARSTAP